MDFPVFINKFVIGFKPIQRTTFWFWFRLVNHSNWRMDDNIRYWDFWNSLNQGILDMNYKWAFETYWGKGAKPEPIYVSQEDYDALQKRLAEPPDPAIMERFREILNRKAPWDEPND